MHIRDPIQVGAHEVKISGAVVRLTVHGDFTADDVQQYAELVDATIAAGQSYCVFGDVTQLKNIGPEARRRFTGWHRKHRCTDCVVLGAKPLIRAVVSLLVRAMSLIGGTSIKLHFFTHAAEAESWVTHWQKHRALQD